MSTSVKDDMDLLASKGLKKGEEREDTTTETPTSTRKGLKRTEETSSSSDEEDEDFNEESIPGDDEEENDESSTDDFINQEIQVDFEVYPADQTDFDGIKKLLKQNFLKEDIDISGFTSLLISQKDLTLVIKQTLDEENQEDPEDEEDDDDVDEVYGVISVISMKSDKIPVKQLNQYIMTRTENSPKLKEILNKSENNGKIAWMVNERFINLSPKLGLPCFESILSDLEKESKSFEYYLMILKILKANVSLKKKHSNKKSKTSDDDMTIIYQNPEEEIFDEKSDGSVEFSVADQCDEDARNGYWDDEDQKFTPFRKIIILTKKSLLDSIEVLKEEFKNK